MKKLILLLCLTNLTGLLRAEQASPANSPAPAIALKQKSFFGVTSKRNPFWPIGWTKPNDNSVEAAPLISSNIFALSSITIGPDARFAILNGKAMQEGQRFGLQMGRQIYTITLHAIEDGQVVLSTPSGEVIVPLRRK